MSTPNFGLVRAVSKVRQEAFMCKTMMDNVYKRENEKSSEKHAPDK